MRDDFDFTDLKGVDLRVKIDGQSMMPGLPPGTWVWVKTLKNEFTNIRFGDIIVFYMGSYDLVCHRVIYHNSRWVWQSGDYYGNYSKVNRDCIIGKVYLFETSTGEKKKIKNYERYIGLLRCYMRIIKRRIKYAR
jgi:signal peptidase I